MTGTAARRPTINDVAARAGVSKGIVSMALRGTAGPSAATAARVLQAAEELGYRADRSARLLALRRTRLLGVTMTVRNAFHAELVEGLQEAAEEAGYDLLLSAVTSTRGERHAVETLLDSRCEAVLLLGPELPTAELIDLAARAAVVVVGRRIPIAAGSPALDTVRAADDTGMALAVEHLLTLGHRQVLHVSGGDGDIAADRRAGYLQAMAAHGLAAHARVLDGDFAEDAGAAAGARLLAEGLPVTAVVAANDRIALGLLDTLSRADVAVPQQLSVVGYDDSALAQLSHVCLTSVSQEPALQARHAVRTALERLDGGRTQRRDVVLQPRLVARRTSAGVPVLGQVLAVRGAL